MKTPFILLSSCALTAFGASIDANLFADIISKKGITVDSRINAPNDKTSPSAAAALAYMNNVFNDDLCGIPAQAYVKTVLDGKSRDAAYAEATRAYVNAYNQGSRLESGSACEAADIAWREAFVAGRDPTYESTKVFMDNWPGLEDGNPCATAGVDYVNAITNGKTHLEAGRIATVGYANAFKNLARKGAPLRDEACKEATKAFMKAIPEKPDPARAVAFNAFMNKIFEEDAPAYDPVCLRALESYIDSYVSGDDLLTSNLKAARAFFEEFNKGSNIPADSPCVAATLSYASQIRNKPSPPSQAAMIAYITEAIKSGERRIDPACAAATSAYWDAYIEDKDEASANEAAGIAYLEALDKYPAIDETSACAKATRAYIDDFDQSIKRK